MAIDPVGAPKTFQLQRTRVIKQIAATECSPNKNGETVTRIIAVCDDNSVWSLYPDRVEKQWDRLPDIPNK